LFEDPEGDELADVDAARAHALEVASDLIADGRLSTIRSWFDCVFGIADESGQLVAKVAFDDAAARRPSLNVFG